MIKFMNQFIKNITFSGIFILSSISVVAQEKSEKTKVNDTLSTESVIVIKTFNPTINDAFKIKLTPNFDEQESTVKKSLDYKIDSVPVASLFVPKKTKSVDVKKEKPISQFSNYAKLLVGNYLNINAEVFSAIEIDRDSQFSISLDHLSSQGGIDDVLLENNYHDTGLQLTYSKQTKNLDWSTDLEFQYQFYNWYGSPDTLVNFSDDQVANTDVGHNFIDFNAGAQLYFDNNIFRSAKVRLRHFNDDFDSSENNIIIKPEFNLSLDDIDVKIPLVLDYLSGTFTDNYLFFPEKYSVLNLGVSPSVAINFQGVDVEVGLSGYISADSENDETRFFVYPNITANYEIPYYNISVYGGVTGGLIQNTYHNAVTENVYTSPELILTPTSQMFNIFAGAKGSLQGDLGYEAKASFSIEKDKPLWIKNPELQVENSAIPYGLNNSFSYVYDDVAIGKIDLKLNYDVENSYGVSLSTIFSAYGVDNQEEAWNLPSVKVNLQGNYFFTEKIKLTTGLFYIGSRNDIDQINSRTVDVDGYFDANIQLDYKITDQWKAYLLGNNLTASSYEQWQDYKVQSIQFLVGAKYQF